MSRGAQLRNTRQRLQAAQAAAAVAEQRLRAAEQERDALRAEAERQREEAYNWLAAYREARDEVRRLRESVENIDALYCGMGAHLRDADAEVEQLREQLRTVAERQREACAAACEARDNDFAHTYADLVRATPLATETKP